MIITEEQLLAVNAGEVVLQLTEIPLSDSLTEYEVALLLFVRGLSLEQVGSIRSCLHVFYTAVLDRLDKPAKKQDADQLLYLQIYRLAAEQVRLGYASYSQEGFTLLERDSLVELVSLLGEVNLAWGEGLISVVYCRSGDDTLKRGQLLLRKVLELVAIHALEEESCLPEELAGIPFSGISGLTNLRFADLSLLFEREKDALSDEGVELFLDLITPLSGVNLSAVELRVLTQLKADVGREKVRRDETCFATWILAFAHFFVKNPKFSAAAEERFRTLCAQAECRSIKIRKNSNSYKYLMRQSISWMREGLSREPEVLPQESTSERLNLPGSEPEKHSSMHPG